MKYLQCRFCNKKIEHINEDCFWWCNIECRDTQSKERLEKQKKENEMHNPPARRGEVDHTNELMKTSLQRALIEEMPVIGDGRAKGKRKCGRCGENGHNSRTCKK